MVIGPPSDAVLVRYLLGEADREDEERFDELSVTDAAFADRLRAIEHDLADAYARRELSPSDRERWEARYLGSQHGRDDLALALAIAARDEEAEGREVGLAVGSVLRPGAGWLMAAAAALVLAVIGGYRVLHRERAPATVAQQSPVVTPAPEPAPPTAVLRVVALTLTPSVRGIDATPRLEIPAGTAYVKLTLRLDGDEYTQYGIAVRDLTANAVVWNSSGVAAEGAGANRSVAVSIPASTFQTRRYLINVSGGPAGAREIVATYALVVVVH